MLRAFVIEIDGSWHCTYMTFHARTARRSALFALLSFTCACVSDDGASDELGEDDTGTEGTATDGTDTETDGTDTDGTETDGTDTGGEPLPAACTAEPVPTAGHEVDMGEWGQKLGWNYEIDVPCQVDAVEEAGEQWRTTLSCNDADDLSHPVEILSPKQPFDVPPWAPGDALSMAYDHWDTQLLGIFDHLALRDGGSDELLFLGLIGDGLFDDYFAPITEMVTENVCGEPPDSGVSALPVRVLVRFELGDESLELIAGEVGDLAIPDSDASYRIHLAEGLAGTCCHTTHHYQLYLQRSP